MKELKDLAMQALVQGVSKADAFLWIVRTHNARSRHQRIYFTVGEVDLAVKEVYAS